MKIYYSLVVPSFRDNSEVNFPLIHNYKIAIFVLYSAFYKNRSSSDPPGESAF